MNFIPVPALNNGQNFITNSTGSYPETAQP
jgi:hypothetical protein